jgi:outer membrane lipase/esterase
MRQVKWALVFAAVLAIAGCGGDGGGTPASRIQFTSQVNFGDSLSDVGTYAVGTIAAWGGGRFTVNSTVNDMPAPTNWTELVASTLGVSAPCSAQTGLDGDILFGFSVPSVFFPDCTSYAQGGAMITYPYGPGNASTANYPNGNPYLGNATLGALTVPVVTQINNHLDAHGGAFTGTEIVFLLAGGNDTVVNTANYQVAVGAAILSGGPAAGEAQAAISGPAAIQAVEVAANELVGYVNDLILAKGAKYVVVLNLPDISTAPFGAAAESSLPGTQAVISAMVQAYNSQLQAGLTSPDVLLVDLYTASVDQIVHPANYGLTNVTDTACNLDPNVNRIGSLICTSQNVIEGDISHYEFADTLHPTPYANLLIALYVAQNLALRGWM